MKPVAGYFFMNGFVVLLVCSIANIRIAEKEDIEHPSDQENQAPVVKIIAPVPDMEYEWGKAVPYEISVSDKEDGESKFQEILPNEVFLEVKYFADAATISSAINQPLTKDPAGLAMIRTSNCLNCHAFHAPLIGPSFYDISKRYSAGDADVDLVAKRVREGSSGIWGNVSMPTHPELTADQTKDIVRWIFSHAADPDVNYYTGTEGYIRINPPAASTSKGWLLLTASYTDHGISEKPNTSLKGADKRMMKTR